MKEPKLSNIIRTLVYILRHHPWDYGLDLDHEGWTDLQQLTDALRLRNPDCYSLTPTRLVKLIEPMDRFQIRDGKIRASYGHSIALRKPPEPATPPATLLHGTERTALQLIFEAGLKPMGRQFVHLTSSFDWVTNFIQSKAAAVILVLDSQAAHQVGITFRQANEQVWLSDPIPVAFLTIYACNAELQAK